MTISISHLNSLSYREVVEELIILNENVSDYWSSADGWAPSETADYLKTVR